MKEKIVVFAIVIVLILTTVILLFNNDINKLNASVETMEYDSDITILHSEIEQLKLLQIEMETEIASLEKEVNSIRGELPNVFLEEFIWTTDTDFNRVEELLNRIDGIKTVYGFLTGVNRGKEISFSIKLGELDDEGKYVKTEKDMEIIFDEYFTPYMAGQYTLSPMDSDEFVNLMERDLATTQEQYLTFKMVNGKAVQIYQGWGK